MKKILTLLLCTVLLCSCSDDDDNNPGNANLNGRWNMNSYTAFLPDQPILEEGDITWAFNNDGTSLTVNNTVSDVYPYMLRSGTYVTTVSDGTVAISYEGFVQTFEYEFTNSTLTLRDIQESGDGPHMQFSRN